jgi:cytochrome c oxidase assembly factor CtaG
MPAAPVTAAGFFTRTPFVPLPLAVVLALLLGYLGAVRRAGSQGEPWPVWRTLSWVAGLAVVAFALCSGMVSWDATNMGVHGTIDMLVGMVAPIFLVLGAPLSLAQAAAGPAGRRRWARALASGPARVVAFPVTAWAIFGGSLFAFYFTGYFAAARSHHTLLQLGHLELLAAGWLLMLPALGADPYARRAPILRIAYLMAGVIVYAVFGMGLESRTSSTIPGVTVTGWHTAGDVIWSAGTVIAIAASAGILWRWLFRDLQQARQVDAADAEELALQASLWRVSRVLARSEAVKEAERQVALKRQTVAVSSRQAEPPSAAGDQ